jgi:hypothetical protein
LAGVLVPHRHFDRNEAIHLSAYEATMDCFATQLNAGTTAVGGLAASLRQILAELDYDHDQRADCNHHRADKRQLFQQSDKDRPDAESSLHMREAQACHTHRISPLAPSSSGLIFQRNASSG